jgi:hypothetical protein
MVPTRRGATTLAVVLLTMTGCGGPVSSAASSAGALSAPEWAEVRAVRGLLEGLPAAIGQIPGAAAAAAGPGVSTQAAAGAIAASPALAPLARAVADPAAATTELLAAYEATRAGRHRQHPGDLATDLAALQRVQSDIIPAIRVVAATVGRKLSASAVASTIVGDRGRPQLAELLTRWPRMYGGFVLVEKAQA